MFAPAAATGAALLCILVWFSPARAMLLSVMHVAASNYFPLPFGDTRAVLAVIDCHRMGVDVYVRVPCDVPLQRPHIYSSVWLIAAQTTITQRATLRVGTIIVLGFCLSLFLLPPARSARAAALLTAATFSNVVLFALWQGNADVIVFVMLAGAASLLLAPLRYRAAGYALLLSAGALKFYPVVAVAAAVREKAAVCLAVAAGAALSLVLFIRLYGHDALRAMRLVPHGWVTQMSGATILPAGLPLLPWDLRHVVSAPPMGPGGWLLCLGLTLGSLAGAANLSRCGPLAASLESRPPRERVFALLGCIVVLACFFVGQSLRYRDIFLLFILPMWANLAVEARLPQVRRVFGAGALAVLALLWLVQVTNGLDHLLSALGVPERAGDVLIAVIWLARESIRWGVITLVMASLMPLSAACPTVRTVIGTARRMRATRRSTTGA